MADWKSLKSETTLSDVASSSDPRIIYAFKAVDNVICGRRGSIMLRRLAYIQLMRLLTLLEGIIAYEKNGGDGSTVMQVLSWIYTSAHDFISNPRNLLRELRERKRAGRSWNDLSKPSPLLVLMYAEAAESVM